MVTIDIEWLLKNNTCHRVRYPFKKRKFYWGGWPPQRSTSPPLIFFEDACLKKLKKMISMQNDACWWRGKSIEVDLPVAKLFKKSTNIQMFSWRVTRSRVKLSLLCCARTIMKPTWGQQIKCLCGHVWTSKKMYYVGNDNM